MSKEGGERRGEGGTAPLTRPPGDPPPDNSGGSDRGGSQRRPSKAQEVACYLSLTTPPIQRPSPLHNNRTHQTMSEQEREKERKRRQPSLAKQKPERGSQVTSLGLERQLGPGAKSSLQITGDLPAQVPVLNQRRKSEKGPRPIFPNFQFCGLKKASRYFRVRQ